MVKGKEGNRRNEQTESFKQCVQVAFSVYALHIIGLIRFLILLVWRVADSASLIHTITQPTTLNPPKRYALHVQFVPPSLNPVARLTVLQRQCVTRSHSCLLFGHKPHILDGDRTDFPAGKAVCAPSWRTKAPKYALLPGPSHYPRREPRPSHSRWSTIH